MPFIHFFMEKSSSSALHRRPESKNEAGTIVNSKKKTTTFTSYRKVLSYQLLMYEIDENNVDTKGEIATFIRPPNKTPLQYADDIGGKTFRCKHVHKKQNLNDIFVKRLGKFFRQSMEGHWSTGYHQSLRFGSNKFKNPTRIKLDRTKMI